MTTFRVFSRNLSAVWGRDGARLLIAFFLSPFVVHTLGDIRYGVWSIVLSVVGYMGLADVGLRKSISKHLNQHLAEKDHEKALGVISTALAILLVTGVLITVVASFVGQRIHLFFDLDPAYQNEIRIVLLISALTLTANLVGSLFKRASEAFDRFDIGAGIQLAGLLLRTAGVVSVLSVSPSLVGLAVVSLLADLLMLVGYLIAAYRVWPGFRLSRAFASMAVARKLWRFGVPAFVDAVSWRIIRFTDLIVVGYFLGVEAVTIYSIGGMVVTHARNVLTKVGVVLAPEMFKRSGVGDQKASRHILIRAANGTALGAIPILIGCIFFAEDFIRLWMGPEYQEAARVMQILAASALAMNFAHSSGITVLGYGKAKLAATMTVIEATMNLGLSILLITVFDLGVVGVALGTLIPAVLIEGIWRPLVALRLTAMSPRRFFSRVIARWVIAGALFALLCFAGKQIPIDGWLVFLLTTAALGLAYLPIGWFGLLDRQARAAVRPG